MSWDLASPLKAEPMLTALGLGVPYPRDAVGYEYQPAPRRAMPKHDGERRFRDGTATSTGAKARERHRWVMTEWDRRPEAVDEARGGG